MKNILFCIVAAFVLSGCQKDIVDYGLAAQKAEMFLTANLNSSLEKKFIASTVDLVADPITPAMSAALKVRADHQNSEFLVAIKAFDELIVPLTDHGQLDGTMRYDLEQLINSSRVILNKTNASEDKAKVAARYLGYLMTYSEPVDLHLLTEFYLTSADVLDESKNEEYRSYILDKAMAVAEEIKTGKIPPGRQELFEWQSNFAIYKLTDSKG
ncbi:hypothetical protein FUA23_12185 [Neolewinella aurantiaca]|uniref:Uncharacterized protein n=1 Tax=Neolewinella aurantiaca TaxID=2602767 RepID=A0A5C7FRQ9_9BACT|nr:lipoprotein [Neolewinella aurantiaca]TXF89039.1 hypothetical protein FUA23_12185 [Neolewinella aurantiaca]